MQVRKQMSPYLTKKKEVVVPLKKDGFFVVTPVVNMVESLRLQKMIV